MVRYPAGDRVVSRLLRNGVVALLGAFAGTGAFGESLQALQDSGVLAKTNNPVAATFFAEQASSRLPPVLAAEAANQLKASLLHQTDTMSLMMQAVFGMGGGKATQQVMDESKRQGNTAKMTLSLALQTAGFCRRILNRST